VDKERVRGPDSERESESAEGPWEREWIVREWESFEWLLEFRTLLPKCHCHIRLN